MKTLAESSKATLSASMGSLTPLASGGPGDHRDYRKSRSISSTLWLVVLSSLALVGVLLVAFLLVYVALSTGMYSRTVQSASNVVQHQQRPVQFTEASLRSERLAEGLGAKGTATLDIVQTTTRTMTKGSRGKRSPLTSSSSTFVEGSSDPTKMFLRRYDDNFDHHRGLCRKRSLAMCSGHVPFNSTTYPNFLGDETEGDANRSLAYFNYIAKSRCNRRIKQLLCTILEPACDHGRPVPPCKKFCRIALEGCAEYIPATLELSAAFDCRRYPDSTDPRVCVNLAMGKGCAADEFQCPDRSCIPRHWTCDGVRDCAFAADEANCQGVACSHEEFQCDRKCVPASWRCDGDRDCADGTDEANCAYRPGCGPDRFKCQDGFGCIPKRWVCDGKAECRDGSDEVGCTQKECTRGDFKCDNGICIPQIWLCDGQDDCKDNSDERGCSAGSSNSNSLTSSSNSFASANLIAQHSVPVPQYQAPVVLQQPPRPQNNHQSHQTNYRNQQSHQSHQQNQRATNQVNYQGQPSNQGGYATAHNYQHRPPFTAFGNFYGQHNNVYRYRLY